MDEELGGPGAVVMAVYQPHAALLARQIMSLRAQTLTNWQCYVGIDGHDPEASRLLTRLIDGDNRFRLLEFPVRAGVYRHFERLLAVVPTSAGWVSLADQDDYWYPNKFERLIRTLAEPGVFAAGGRARIVSDDGVALGVTHRRAGDVVALLLRNQVTGSLTLFRSEVVRLALPFPEQTAVAMHDHWLGVCAAALGEVRMSDEAIQDYVQHSANVLGEAKPLGLGDFFAAAFCSGSIGAHIDDFVSNRWGWRVFMARAIQARLLPDHRQADIDAVGRGRLSTRLAIVVAGNVASGHLRPLAGAGALASALRWGRTTTGSRV